MKDTHYQILRVSNMASIGEIKDAYKERCKEFDLDIYPKTNTTQCMRTLVLINEAYRVLRTPNLRQAYDHSLAGSDEMEDFATYVDYYSLDYTLEEQEEYINWMEDFATRYIKKTSNNTFKGNKNYFELTKQLLGQFFSIISTERYALDKMKKKKTTNSK